jgi:transcription factor SPN1
MSEEESTTTTETIATDNDDNNEEDNNTSQQEVNNETTTATEQAEEQTAAIEDEEATSALEFDDEEEPAEESSSKRRSSKRKRSASNEEEQQDADDDDYKEDELDEEDDEPKKKKAKKKSSKKGKKKRKSKKDMETTLDEEDEYDSDKKKSKTNVDKPTKEASDQFKQIMEEIKPRRAASAGTITGLDDEAARIADDLVDRMKAAAVLDEEAMKQQKPAMSKINMLAEVSEQASRVFLQPMLLEKDFLKVLVKWLHPLPNKQLPNVNIRSTILNILVQLPVSGEQRILSRRDRDYDGINTENIRESGIGKAVKMLSNHPKETQENRKKANQLIERWSRLAYNLADNYQQENPMIEMALPDSPPRSKSNAKRPRLSAEEEAKIKTSHRARVPKKSTFDFTKRPSYSHTIGQKSKAVAPPPSVQSVSSYNNTTQKRLAKKFTEMTKKR